MKQADTQQLEHSETETTENVDSEQPLKSKKRTYIFPVILFLIVVVAIAAAGYQGWMLFQQQYQQTQERINDLQSQLAQRPSSSQINKRFDAISQTVVQADDRLKSFEQGHQALTASTEKLYELYGRDENGWKLAEVEYLMSIAQHKLVLENDFEGAAKTLQAASNRIAELADPGLLPVRLMISEEIARLKTRARPDLVGMTLLLSRLARQIGHLKPGYQSQIETAPVSSPTEETASDAKPGLQQRMMNFITSLVTVKSSHPEIKTETQTIIIDVGEKLEDNLKLTRWTVLERDAFQYNKLMAENLSLFKQYYDLNTAANADFYQSLQQLEKSQIKPELPDISGSLRLLKEIQQKQQQAPEQETDNG